MTWKQRPRRYSAWWSMKRRCYAPNDPEYPNYGGRGIGVCDRWRDSFSAYMEDVGLPPQPGMSLDRIDNDGDYEPGNVRWADARTQSWNQRNPPGLRTHCPKGHPYDEANTRVESTTGKRVCRACRRVASRRRAGSAA